MPVKQPPPDAELPDLYNLIIGEIARLNLIVSKDSKDWAGRESLIKWFMAKRQITRAIAEPILDQAVGKLCDKAPDKDSVIEHRLAIVRLHQLRQLIFEYISTPKNKTEYEIRPKLDADGKIMRYTRKSGEHYKGDVITEKVVKRIIEENVIPAQLLDKLVAIETLLARLQHLESAGESSSRIREMIEHLENAGRGNSENEPTEESSVEITSKQTLSVAQQVRRMSKGALLPKHGGILSGTARPILLTSTPAPVSVPAPALKIPAPSPASAPVEGESEPVTLPAGPPPDATGQRI